MKKSFKTLLVFAMVVVMLLTIILPTFASYAGVNDESDLFSSSEESKLSSRILTIKDKYGYDVYIVTSNSKSGSTNSYARTLFKEKYGSNGNGVIFYIYKGNDKSVREYAFETFGAYEKEYGWEYINKAIEKRVLSDLKYNRFYDALDEFLDCVENLCKDPYYFDTEKKPTTSSIDWSSAIIGGLVVGFIFSLIYIGILSKKMKVVKVATTAREYIVPGSFNKTRERDHFLYATTTRVRIKNSSSSGGSRSSSHRSSGGGGRF